MQSLSLGVAIFKTLLYNYIIYRLHSIYIYVDKMIRKNGTVNGKSGRAKYRLLLMKDDKHIQRS